MESIELGTLFNEWLVIKSHNQEMSIEEFGFRKYLEFHKNDNDKVDTDEQKKFFYDRVESWNKNRIEFETYVGKSEQTYAISEPLELWQGAEMLNNVIAELDMELEEEYRYLANVKLLIGYKLAQLLDKESSKKMIQTLEDNYENEWKKAENMIADYELQDLFSETVAMMQYSGITYDDETREILAKLGFNYDVEFSVNFNKKIDNDIQFLANFLISEIVLEEELDNSTKEEKRMITEQVVPICVSSATMVQNGNNAQHMEQLTMTYISKIVNKENMKFLNLAAILLIASKVISTLLKASLMGITIGVTLGAIWNYSKKPLNLEKKTENDLITFLKTKYFQNQKNTFSEELKDGAHMHFQKNKNEEMEFENNEE